MKRLLVASLFVIGACLLFSQDAAKPQGRYCGSSQSTKYHYPSCRWAQKISPANMVWFQSKEEAAKKGYVPCKVCKP